MLVFQCVWNKVRGNKSVLYKMHKQIREVVWIEQFAKTGEEEGLMTLYKWISTWKALGPDLRWGIRHSAHMGIIDWMASIYNVNFYGFIEWKYPFILLPNICCESCCFQGHFSLSGTIQSAAASRLGLHSCEIPDPALEKKTSELGFLHVKLSKCWIQPSLED